MVTEGGQDRLAQDFVAFAVQSGVLRFGEFKTKAGRLSPYFFDAGLFYDGAALKKLAQFYAKAILAAGTPFDMLFGPAYKGIPLVAAVAIALAEEGRSVRYSFNRKEVKDHGEGGSVIGAPLAGKVLIVDDVISAGRSEMSTRLVEAKTAACSIARPKNASGCWITYWSRASSPATSTTTASRSARRPTRPACCQKLIVLPG